MKNVDLRIKRIGVLIFVLLVILGVVFGSQRLGAYYEKKVATNPQERLSNLLSSNLFAPSDNKRLLIIGIYNELGYPERGVYWIESLKNEKYNFVKAGYYLERQNTSRADYFLNKIEDPALAEEMKTFRTYINGQLATIPDPLTDYGQAASGIGVRGSYSFLASLKSIATGDLDYAANLIESNHPKIALKVLNGMAEKSNSAYLLELQAKAMEKDSQEEKALELLETGVNRYPSNTTILNRALDLAKKTKNKTLEERFQKRLELISKLSR